MSAAVVGAGTGAGVVGARGEMMEMKSERMKAKRVIVFPWLVWFVYIQVYGSAGEVSSYMEGMAA